MAALPNGFNFSVAVTTSAAQIGTTASNPSYGFWVRAASANGAKVYFGFTAGVTALTAAATDGYELAAGESFFIDRNMASDVTGVYAIAASGSQKICVVGG